MSPAGPGQSRVRSLRTRVADRVHHLSFEWRDALVYAMSACFAAVTALVAGIPLYRQWGEMAVGPYAAAAVGMAVVAWFAGRRTRAARLVEPGDRDPTTPPTAPPADGPAPVRSSPTDPFGSPKDRGTGIVRASRVVAFLVVLIGATVVPLALEVVWASEGNVAAHVQPEVLVVERAGVRVDAGKDPYQVVDKNGRILIHQSAVPVYELYYPYLPGMVLFGFSSGSKVTARLTDARIQFLLFTALVTVVALSRLRPATDARYRALQVLTVLPPAALPLATGGDDMPVVALMLAGLVALQRRKPFLAGLAFGAASSLKFTAWPLAGLAIFVVVDPETRHAVWRYLAGAALVVVPVVVPVALRNPAAFIDNVIRFPLGLAGVASPAASALPGHLFVSAFPGAHRAYVLTVAAVGACVLVWLLVRRRPTDAAGAASLTGWLMLAAILLAPATRVGYLLYPVNLFVWAWLLRRSDTPELVKPRDEPAPGVTVEPAAVP